MTTPYTATRFALLHDLFDLARAQRRALEADNLERFEALLDDRQTIIEQLQAYADDVAGAPLPANVILFPGSLPSEADDALALDTLIRGILEHDRQNEQVLTGLLDGIRAELPALESGRRTAERYVVGEPRMGFIDRQS